MLPGQSEYVVAGRFRVTGTSDGARLGEFAYDRGYLSRRDAVGLDPVQLRLTERVLRTRGADGLFGAIRDSLPAFWGLVVSGEAGGGTVPGFAKYLEHAPHERCGAFVITQGAEPPDSRQPVHSIDDLPRLLEAVDTEHERQNTGQAGERPMTRGILAADTPKATVEYDRRLWIAKFCHGHEAWNQARVRHATLQLARECGLNAVPSRIERVGDRDILLLEREDREWMGDGYACHRGVSGLTLLSSNITPEERLRWSYLSLADEVRRTSSHPREDLRDLFGRICFNAAIANLTDHPGRPTMLDQGGGWRLFGASGTAPTPSADRTNGDLAMICGPLGRSPSRENIAGGAGRFLLDRPSAEVIFDRIAETVHSSWYRVMRRSGVSEEDCKLVARSIQGR